METEVDKILKKLTPPKVETNSQPKENSKSQKIKCNSCNKMFEENGILKHIANVSSCKAYYEQNGELDILKSNAAERRRHKKHQIYLNEKEVRAEQYQIQKKEFEAFEKYEFFEKRRAELESSFNRQLDNAKHLFRNWRGIACRGARRRKEIEKLRQSKDFEVLEDMVKIETFIDTKIAELENCLEEVAEEVKGMIGHWVFDEAGKWMKSRKDDDNYRFAIFESVEHHIEEEMESMYVIVLQNLKDSAAKIRKEIQKHKYEDELSKPMRLKNSFYLGSHFWVPRNVVLK